VVLFCRTLAPEVIEGVLRAEDNSQAAGTLLADGLELGGRRLLRRQLEGAFARHFNGAKLTKASAGAHVGIL
jgi:hypothetical protein